MDTRHTERSRVCLHECRQPQAARGFDYEPGYFSDSRANGEVMLTRQYDRFSTSFDPVPVSFSGEAQGVGRLYDNISYGVCKVESSASPSHRSISHVTI